MGWLWYLGMLVPVIGLVQVGSLARADRYTYLPQIGLYILLTWTAVELTASWQSRRWVLGGGAMAVLAVLITCARAQTAYWRDSESLWTHTLACTSDNRIAHYNLGVVFAQQGRTKEAIAQLQKALAIEPDYAEPHFDLGNIFLQQGRIEEAIAYYQKALTINPDDADIHNNLGNVFLQQGRMDEAISSYQKALAINPNYAEAHNNLGKAFRQQGRLEEAITHFQKALTIKPDYAEIHNNLGVVFAQQGRTKEAIAQLQKALAIEPDYAEAHYNLGNAVLQQGHMDEAIAHFQKALTMKPDYVEAQNNMAWVLATCPQASLRNGVKAVGLAEQANQLTGGKNPVVLCTLAAAYAEAGRFPKAIETVQHAMQLAEAQSNTALAEALQSQLKLYQVGIPFHGTEQAP
jgi:Flp pilus assembly protein TadD